MIAMIFAAGLGTRLGAITHNTPKALVEVGGIPMLKRVILKLKDAGIRRMVVNVHHYAEDIIAYLDANSRFGIEIDVSDERDRLLDTGGGLLKARKLLEGTEPILLHNADILTDFDIDEMHRCHERSDAEVTLLVGERSTSRYFLFNERMRMVGWKNMRTGEIRSPWHDDSLLTARPLAFGGIHIISPDIFDTLASYRQRHDEKFSITPFYVEECKKLNISGFIPEHNYSWIDIGKPDSLIAAESIVAKLQPTFRQE